MNQSFNRDEKTRQLIETAGLETPSPDFTNKVMQAIQPVESSYSFRPPIKRSVWVIILSLQAIAFGLFFFLPENLPAITLPSYLNSYTFDLPDSLPLWVIIAWGVMALIALERYLRSRILS